MSRNAPCPCGSGLRFKACHGSVTKHDPAGAGETLDEIAARGLRFHQAGDLSAAAECYRQVLATDAQHFDVLHMLGAIAIQEERFRDALPLLARAGTAVGWTSEALRTNLSITCAALLSELSVQRRMESRREEASRRRENRRLAIKHGADPLISVIVPCYRHERFVTQALQSVFAQSWRRIELIVIDDGSPDNTARVAREALSESPFPTQFITRENRGAHATINEGLNMAQGDYVNVLNSDDLFTSDRLEKFVAQVRCTGARWGFARCQVIDGEGQVTERHSGTAAGIVATMNAPDGAACASDFFVSCNPAISSGNIFVERELAIEVGGFSGLRYNHDWDFCMQAMLFDEPVILAEELYSYRLHGANTIEEDRTAARREADQMLVSWFSKTRVPYVAENPLATTELNDPLVWAVGQLRCNDNPRATEATTLAVLDAIAKDHIRPLIHHEQVSTDPYAT